MNTHNTYKFHVLFLLLLLRSGGSMHGIIDKASTAARLAL